MSSSETRVVETSASTAAITRSTPKDGALPVIHQSASATTPALIASEARPNVMIVSGRAKRISVGHRNALKTEIASATSSASANESAVDAVERVGEDDQHHRLDGEQHEPARQQAREMACLGAHPGATARHEAWRRWLA